MREYKEKIKILTEHFEKKGFIVGDGLNYGVDFLLYTDKKSKVHSKYAVLIKRGQTFQHLLSISRLCISVKKELILVDLDENDKITMWNIDRMQNPNKKEI